MISPNVNSYPTAIATFAGGCFWCTEADFGKTRGVVKVTSGYAGGKEENPTYEQVCSGQTSHVEAVQIVYDPSQISYKQLVDLYWKGVDPTDPKGQFFDKGEQYKTVIFYHTQEQKQLAEESKKEVQKYFEKPIVTQIKKFTTFYPTEEEHQGYYKKCPLRYTMYRKASGRDGFRKSIWGDKED